MDKMRCQRIQPYLLALVEGELKQSKREKVARHVAACPACASAMRSLRQTLRVVQTIDVPEPSPAFWQEFGVALHQRIRREEAAHQGRRPGRLWELFRLPKPALAAVAGTFSAGSALLTLVLTGIGGVLAGVLLAYFALWTLARVEDIQISVLLQFISTFAVWIIADRLGLSAIITMVAYAMTAAQRVGGVRSAGLDGAEPQHDGRAHDG